MMMRTLTAGILASLITAVAVLPAQAGGRQSLETYDRAGYVVAESEYGNGIVRGPVRHTRLGRQVRLPGGSWVHCGRSCTETLRVKTVDFWHSEEGAGPRNATTHDGGIFGKLGIRRNW